MNIVFIPARGGSKSIPLKNIKLLNGKPLIYYTLKSAATCPIIDKIIVATDHPEIKKTVLNMNFPKVEVYDRDDQNAQDSSTTESVLLEYIYKTSLPDDTLIFLMQATSPMTTTDDILGIYEKRQSLHADAALTCVREKRFYWTEDGHPINYDYRKRPRRQNFKGSLVENGAIYLNTVKNIKTTKCLLGSCDSTTSNICVYEVPSHQIAVEADEEQDWVILESLIKKHMK